MKGLVNDTFTCTFPAPDRSPQQPVGGGNTAVGDRKADGDIFLLQPLNVCERERRRGKHSAATWRFQFHYNAADPANLLSRCTGGLHRPPGAWGRVAMATPVCMYVCMYVSLVTNNMQHMFLLQTTSNMTSW